MLFIGLAFKLMSKLLWSMHEKQKGNNLIGFLAFEPQNAPYGEDWHPTISTHQLMANKLVAFINDKLTGFSNVDLNHAKLQIYPIPALHSITVENLDIRYPIEIYSELGQLIMEVERNDKISIVDIGLLKNGNYFLKNGYNSVAFIKD